MGLRSGVTENIREGLSDLKALLPAGANDAHENGERPRPRDAPIAGTGLSVDDGGADCLFGRPVGRLDAVMPQEDEERILVALQMSGEAPIPRMAQTCGQKAPRPGLERSGGDRHAVGADGTLVSAVPGASGPF